MRRSEHAAGASRTAAHAAAGSGRPAPLLFIRPQALAATPGSLTHFLPSLDRRLHIVAATLELPQNSFRGHAALEMLDRSLDALVSDLDLEWLTRYGFARIRQGSGYLSRIAA